MPVLGIRSVVDGVFSDYSTAWHLNLHGSGLDAAGILCYDHGNLNVNIPFNTLSLLFSPIFTLVFPFLLRALDHAYARFLVWQYYIQLDILSL